MIILQLAAGGAAALSFFFFFFYPPPPSDGGVNQSQTREALRAPPGEAALSVLAASAAVSLQRNPSHSRKGSLEGCLGEERQSRRGSRGALPSRATCPS